MGEKISIQALKYGSRPHYEWETELLERTERHIAVLGHRGRKLRHHTKGCVFTVDNWTIELFFPELWFTVSADVVDGEIRQYYCNINEPARIEGNAVSFVDLDLDLVFREGAWRIVDEEEFAQNAARFGYPEQLQRRARRELAELQTRVAERRYPFDGTIERYVRFIP